MSLVLSIFPGIDLLGRAFEEEGFCIVRGPDVLWGGDVRAFHPPPGQFDGIIGGPPCQGFSRLRFLNPLSGQKHGNMIPEFERCVSEAQPAWFLMENVLAAPSPIIEGYQVQQLVLNNRWLGQTQQRVRRFYFGSGDGRALMPEVTIFEAIEKAPAVLAGHGPVGRGNGYAHQPTLADAAELQGLPRDFLEDSPFTSHGKRQVIGNGVPLPMGRAVAVAVARAMKGEER